MTTVTWTIKNFEMCPRPCGIGFQSPEFSFYSSECQIRHAFIRMPRFRLILCPRGIDNEVSDHVSLYVWKVDEDDFVRRSLYWYSCKLGVKTSEGKRFLCKEIENESFLTRNEEGFSKLISREKLFNERALLLADGNLTVFCKIYEVWRHDLSMIGCSFPVSRHCTDEDLTDLSDAFTRLYESEKFCDLDFFVEGKHFKVHKALLNARCPELLDKVEGDKCLVEGIGAVIMDALLLYLYSGSLKKSQLNLFDLVKLACMPDSLRRLLKQRIRKIQFSTVLTQTIFAFSWNIENFNGLKPRQNLQYTLIGDDSSPWTWFNFFLTVVNEDEGSFVITIERYSSKRSRVICKIKVNGFSKTFERTFAEEKQWTLPAFKTEEILTGSESPNSLNELRFYFEITVSDGSGITEKGKIEFHPCKPSLYDQVDDLKLFRNDLIELRRDSEFSDVTLLSGKDKFPAHKFLLCARSSVFSEMFHDESLESDTVVTELDPWVVENMLSYIYHGDFEYYFQSTTKEILGMYTAANKYCIPALKRKCFNLLKPILSAENAGEILAAAHEWDDRDLKELVYEFVLSHPDEIASSEEWKETMMKRSDVAV